MTSIFKGLRKWWDEYLSRLSKANKESFGGGRMDCCGLSKASEGKKSR
jgi:hypothetical protein